MGDQTMRQQFEASFAEGTEQRPEDIAALWIEEDQAYDDYEYQAAWNGWIAATNAANRRFVEIVDLLKTWHSQRIDKLQMVRDAKPETTLIIQCGDSEPLELDGKAAAALKAGVHVALELFEKFPITVTRH